MTAFPFFFFFKYSALLTIIFVTSVYIVTHFEATSIITTSVEAVELLWERELMSEGPMADIENRVGVYYR